MRHLHITAVGRWMAAIVFLLALAPVAWLLVYLHEWAHGIGSWIQGWPPCVAPNNFWPASEPDRLLLLGGLAGPAFSLAVGTGALVMHIKSRAPKGLTFADPVGVLTFLLPLAFGVRGVQITTDEAIVAALLPAKQEVMYV